MTVQQRKKRLLSTILLYYLFLKVKRAQRVTKVIRHIHAPAQAFRNTDLSGASIADLGTRDHDLLTGLGDDDHTQYFHTDGSEPMTGDLSMGTNKLKWSNFMIKQSAAGIQIRNVADTAYGDWVAKIGYFQLFRGLQNDLTIYANDVLGAFVQIATRKPAVTSVFYAKDGHAYFPSLPVADPADGTGKLWCDAAAGNVIKVGT